MAKQKIPWFNYELKLQRAHMKSHKHMNPHLYWPHLQQSHTHVAWFHTCRAGTQLCEQPLCVQGTPLNHKLVHGAWYSMLRRWIADVSPPHVHGDCSYQEAYSHHLPLWSTPTSMRHARSQINIQCVKTNVVPSNPRISYGTIFPVCAKSRSPGKIGLCLGSKHPGEYKGYQNGGGHPTGLTSQPSPM